MSLPSNHMVIDCDKSGIEEVGNSTSLSLSLPSFLPSFLPSLGWKSNFVPFSLKIWHLVAQILVIFLISYWPQLLKNMISAWWGN